MSKYSMIREAQSLTKVRKSPHLETLKEIQKLTGKTLTETIEFLGEAFTREITPEDYDEWIRQVVMQAEDLKDGGTPVNLNKRQVFNDLLGDILENDPAGKVNLGDSQLTKHVFDATWKRYQGTRDHLKAANVMKAREEEEMLQRMRDAAVEDEGMNCPCPRCRCNPCMCKHMEDEERDVMVSPRPEEREEFRPSDGSERYDDEDMSYRRDEEPMDEEPMDRDLAEENPYEEGTPEFDAWMAGFQAGMEADMEGPDMDAEYEGRGDEEDLGSQPVDMEQEDEEEPVNMDLVSLRQNLKALARNRRPLADRKMRDAEDEGYSPMHWRNEGYKAAKSEYHHGRKVRMPSESGARRAWEQGYEEFMRDTEGQRDLARRGAEDEGSILKSVISKPRNTLNRALKSVEDEGADAFGHLKLPQNPHPENSLAQKAWAKGFKNAVRGAFGFDVKPIEPARKKKKK